MIISRQISETKCISGDKEYKMGETRISSDGCNTCTCMYSGPWECTTMACNRLGTIDLLNRCINYSFDNIIIHLPSYNYKTFEFLCRYQANKTERVWKTM